MYPTQILKGRSLRMTPTIRVGVILAHLGKLNTRALKYLILHLNTIQKSIEFELLTMHVSDPLLAELQPNRLLDREVFVTKLADFRTRLKNGIADMQGYYRLSEASIPDHFAVVSLARFADRYYAVESDGIAVQALGYWDRHMAPPSIVEFIITILMRQACSHASSLGSAVHLGTKGCLFDFTAAIDEARYKALQAFVCSTCRATLAKDGLPRLADDAVAVLDKHWLGTADDPSSPASIASKLGYDLFLTRGVKPTLGENVRGLLRDEGTKEFLKLVFGIFFAWLVFRLGIKGR